MALQCQDCGFKGKKAIEGGCPACGSARFRVAKRQKREKPEKEFQPIRTLFMIALWALLFYKLYEHFIA